MSEPKQYEGGKKKGGVIEKLHDRVELNVYGIVKNAKIARNEDKKSTIQPKHLISAVGNQICKNYQYMQRQRKALTLLM